MTMAIILLHMFWGVVFFDACEKQHWWAVAAVVISHLVVSCLVSVCDGTLCPGRELNHRAAFCPPAP